MEVYMEPDSDSDTECDQKQMSWLRNNNSMKLPVHWPSPERGQQSTKGKKTSRQRDRLNRLALPRRSLSVVTAMSRRKVIRHYMRSDTGGLLVWHIRDMLRIIMRWCQLKAWNALRGGLNVFPASKQPEKHWLRKNDGFLEHCLHKVTRFLEDPSSQSKMVAVIDT